MRTKKIGNSQLRSFGLIVATGFAVVGSWPLAFRAQSPRTWALILAVVLSSMAVVRPSALKPFHRVWMSIGEALGWLNSRIILIVAYYVVIVPIGVIRRLSGNDPMQRKFERDTTTYKMPRVGRPPSHMRRQY
jgi:ABC-type glycerol-3-phosphate transport system permease component